LSFKKKFFKNTITLAGFNYTAQIIEFASTYILSRLLLPEEYGFVALITVFTGFIAIFVDAGLSYAVIRSDYGRRYFKAISNLSLLIGTGLFLIMAALSYPITLFYGNKALLVPTIILGSNFIIQSINVVPSAILHKELKFNRIGLIRLLGTALRIGLMILMAYLGYSYWSLIIPVLIQAFFNNIMFSIMSGFFFRFFPWIYLRLAFRTTKSLMANITGFNLINYWARNADNLIIGKFYGAADLGIYNRAYKLLYMALNSTTNLFGSVLFPSLKELKSKGGDVKGEYESLLGIISIITFPIGAFMILLAEPFVRFMWGEDWLAVAELLPYFGLLLMLQTLLSTVGNIYILFNKEKILFRIGGITAVIMVTAIVSGALISVVHVARFYAVSYILFTVPLNLHVGFIRNLGFTVRQVVRFWLPKLLLLLGTLVAIWLDQYLISAGFLLAYMLHIVVFQYKDLVKLWNLIKRKMGRKNG
jgi:O-antigen/teichoic acid export membrane protein